jgi:hypothetical protein
MKRPDDSELASPIATFEASSRRGCCGCKALVSIFEGQGFNKKEGYSMTIGGSISWYDNVTLFVWSDEDTVRDCSSTSCQIEITNIPGKC